jgi:hypothetical protein
MYSVPVATQALTKAASSPSDQSYAQDAPCAECAARLVAGGSTRLPYPVCALTVTATPLSVPSFGEASHLEQGELLGMTISKQCQPALL